MTTLALISAFPPARNSLNEYGFHLAKAFARREDIDRIIILADIDDDLVEEIRISPKIEVWRVWEFNKISSAKNILKVLKDIRPDYALFNLQTASFGDKEIPAALGLLAPMLSQSANIPTGVIMHNLIDAVDLAKTNLAGNKWRQKLVGFAGTIINKALLKSGYMSVTLDSFLDILQDKYKSSNAFLVPHGSFNCEDEADIPRLDARPNRIVTMGKFGTYKKLERMIGAVQTLNAGTFAATPIELIIGGSDHPAVKGYMQDLRDQHAGDPNIIFHGYVAESAVPGFFKQGRIAVFDYDSTTGSSGVLHQAATFGTPPIYPLMGDFIDVTEREGLRGFHYTPLDGESLTEMIEQVLTDTPKAQHIADNNLSVSKGLSMDVIASMHMGLLEQVEKKRFFVLRNSNKQALWLRPRYEFQAEGE